MRPRLINHRQRDLITTLVLVALALQALIPAGFMPAASRPFELQICQAGFLTTDSGHDLGHTPGGQAHAKYCPFGSAPAAGPSPTVTTQVAAWLKVSPSIIEFEPSLVSFRLETAHQPRGPPHLA
jgi:hypothetical protein